MIKMHAISETVSFTSEENSQPTVAFDLTYKHTLERNRSVSSVTAGFAKVWNWEFQIMRFEIKKLGDNICVV